MLNPELQTTYLQADSEVGDAFAEEQSPTSASCPPPSRPLNYSPDSTMLIICRVIIRGPARNFKMNLNPRHLPARNLQLIIVSLCAAISALAQQPTVTFSGLVTDQNNGQSIAGVAIVAQGNS